MGTPKHHIGTRIRHARERNGRTQTAVAGLCGISVEYLSQIERGLKTPSGMCSSSSLMSWARRSPASSTGNSPCRVWISSPRPQSRMPSWVPRPPTPATHYASARRVNGAR
ncbi:helix-turn-helix domain-containing protein [Streptomyces daliensis]